MLTTSLESVLILIITLLVMYWLIKFTRNRNHGINISGPKGNLLTGNLLQLKPYPHQKLTEWAKEYGDVYMIRLGLRKRNLVINDLDKVRSVFVNHSREVSGRRLSFSLGWFTSHHNGIANNQPTEDWHRSRKAVHNCLQTHSKGGMMRNEQIITASAQKLMRIFNSKTGRAFDPRDDLYNFSLGVTSILLLGGEHMTDSAHLEDMKNTERSFDSVLGVGNKTEILDMLPWLRYVGYDGWTKLQNVSARCYQLFDRLKSDIVSTYDPEDVQTLMHSLMSDICDGNELNGTINEYTPQYTLSLKTESVLRGVLIDILLAGTMTTTLTSCVILGVLAHYPDIQHRVRNEVDQLGCRAVTLADRDKLPYTQAFILEVLRNSSIASLVRHTVTSEFQMWGHVFPKGMNIIANVWAIHHDPEFWDDPFIYKPERFLNEDGSLIPADHPNRRHLVPFGFGHRLCPGENFAKTRLLLLTAMEVQTFKILPETKMIDPSQVDPRNFGYDILLKPTRCHIVLESRD